MSTRKRSAAASKKKEEKALKKVKVMVPKGKVPFAIVTSRHGAGMVQRRGRGFSIKELGDAGLPIRLARRWDVKVDTFRRSSLGPNVEALKVWYVPQKPVASAQRDEVAEAPTKKRPRRKKAETG